MSGSPPGPAMAKPLPALLNCIGRLKRMETRVKRLLVVGASGDVGQGVVAAALQGGWQVVAAGRGQQRLDKLRDKHSSDRLAIVAGDLGSEETALAMWSAATACFGAIDAVLVAVNAPNAARPTLDWQSGELLDVLRDNVITHFVAAKTFIPRLGEDGVYIGIGGGTADFVIPGMGQLSMAQAALRMMYRAIGRDYRGRGPAIRELIIVSMVNGESKRDKAAPDWVTDVEVGQHVCAIVTDPARFPGPILALKSRDQIGQSEVAS